MQVIEYLTTNLNNLIELGGIYVYPILGTAILLWYMLGYRYHLLSRGSKYPISVMVQKILNREIKPKGIIGGAIYEVIKRVQGKKFKSEKALEDVIDEIILDYDANIQSYKKAVKALTISAPLLGLLGTVDGMITMFNALVSGSFYAQGGGIAGGISKALITTELGLIVAVPGLIIGNLLNSKQKKLEEELIEIKYFLLENFKKEVENEKI